MNGTNPVATEHATHAPMPPAPANLARIEQQQAAMVRHVDGPLQFSDEQREMIRDTFANGASEAEFAVLLEVAKVRRLNPLLKQIHFVKRKDKKKNKEIWSTQVSIDGLRAIAERTGLYDGQDEPEYVYGEPHPKTGKRRIAACRVKVYKKGIARPFVGFAVFDEYAQRYPSGDLTQFWNDKPHVMIAKCAEALAIRKGFPEDTGSLYIAEELTEDSEPETKHQPANSARAANGQPITSDGEVVEREIAEIDEDTIIVGFLDRIDAIRVRADEHAVVTDIMRAKLSEAGNNELRSYLKKHKEKLAQAVRDVADAEGNNGGPS